MLGVVLCVVYSVVLCLVLFCVWCSVVYANSQGAAWLHCVELCSHEIFMKYASILHQLWWVILSLILLQYGLCPPIRLTLRVHLKSLCPPIRLTLSGEWYGLWTFNLQVHIVSMLAACVYCLKGGPNSLFCIRLWIEMHWFFAKANDYILPQTKNINRMN